MEHHISCSKSSINESLSIAISNDQRVLYHREALWPSDMDAGRCLVTSPGHRLFILCCKPLTICRKIGSCSGWHRDGERLWWSWRRAKLTIHIYIYIFTITTVYFVPWLYYFIEYIHLLYVFILYYLLCIHIHVSYCPSNIEPHSTTTSLRPALPALAAKAMSSWQRILQNEIGSNKGPALVHLWWFNSI